MEAGGARAHRGGAYGGRWSSAAVGRARGAFEDWFIYSREVGWELVGSSRRSEHAGMGGNARRRAIARRPMAHGVRCAGECGLATWRPPAVVDVTQRSTPVQRSDQWAFRPLGMRARRGYGAYGGVPT
jgi:hypothetical protein